MVWGGLTMNASISKIETTQMGASAFIAAYIREIGFHEIINNQVVWDEQQCKRSPGLLAEGLVVNMLTSRLPLYKIQDFYSEIDPQILFGPKVTAEDFNDDALGRMLDRLSEINLDCLYGTLVLRATQIHKISLNSLHGDTTSVSVYGEYANNSSESLNITYGYSKDHRPECKQITVGMVSNQEGIPLFGNIGDGNLSDVIWNEQILKHLPELIDELGSSESLYVADSKLITRNNLRSMPENLSFLSRLPNTFALASDLKDSAFKEKEWQEVGKLSPKKDAADYRIQSSTGCIDGREYRFLIVHSSKLDKRKRKSLKDQAEKEHNKLKKISIEVAKLTFACETDAKQALIKHLKEHQGTFYSFVGEVECKSVIKRKPGRPKKNEPPLTENIYSIKLNVSDRDEVAWKKAVERASTFVLITNFLDSTELTDYQLLERYKNQNCVEMRFRFLKNPTLLDGVFLHKPNRVKALGYLFLMALLIYALMERRVRNQLEKEREVLNLRYRKNVKQPTGALILEQFKNVSVVKIDLGQGQTIIQLPSNLSKTVVKLLRLSGFDASIYIGSLKAIE